jgi:hypothetical protein
MNIDDEMKVAELKLWALIEKYQEDNEGQGPNIIYISDDEELQSLMMWECVQQGWDYDRTTKPTYADYE